MSGMKGNLANLLDKMAMAGFDREHTGDELVLSVSLGIDGATTMVG